MKKIKSSSKYTISSYDVYSSISANTNKIQVQCEFFYQIYNKDFETFKDSDRGELLDLILLAYDGSVLFGHDPIF